MRLLNLNVGIKIDNSARIADFVKAVDAEVVAFQEIVRPLEESVKPQYRSQEDIKRLLGDRYDYSFFGPIWVAIGINEGETVLHDFGGHLEQGGEVLSRFPIIEATNEHYYKTYAYELDWTHWKEQDHGRALQRVVVEIGDRDTRLQILNIHGVWTEDKRGDERTQAQCRYIVEAAEREDLPTILTGDFNLLPDTDSIKIVEKAFTNLVSVFDIKTTRPEFEDELERGGTAVDYIFVSEDIRVNDFRVINTDISDHLPMVLEFEI